MKSALKCGSLSLFPLFKLPFCIKMMMILFAKVRFRLLCWQLLNSKTTYQKNWNWKPMSLFFSWKLTFELTHLQRTWLRLGSSRCLKTRRIQNRSRNVFQFVCIDPEVSFVRYFSDLLLLSFRVGSSKAVGSVICGDDAAVISLIWWLWCRSEQLLALFVPPLVLHDSYLDLPTKFPNKKKLKGSWKKVPILFFL